DVLEYLRRAPALLRGEGEDVVEVRGDVVQADGAELLAQTHLRFLVERASYAARSCGTTRSSLTRGSPDSDGDKIGGLRLRLRACWSTRCATDSDESARRSIASLIAASTARAPYESMSVSSRRV